jgi:hypothetical protein
MNAAIGKQHATHNAHASDMHLNGFQGVIQCVEQLVDTVLHVDKHGTSGNWRSGEHGEKVTA